MRKIKIMPNKGTLYLTDTRSGKAEKVLVTRELPLIIEQSEKVIFDKELSGLAGKVTICLCKEVAETEVIEDDLDDDLDVDLDDEDEDDEADGTIIMKKVSALYAELKNSKTKQDKKRIKNEIDNLVG